MNPSKMFFEQKYNDNSGVQYAVRYFGDWVNDEGTDGIIQFEHIDTVDIPLDKIDWVIQCLEKIKWDSK